LPDEHRPQLVVVDAPARVVLLAHGGKPLADRLVGPGAPESTIEIPQGTERIIAIGQALPEGREPSPDTGTGLLGWHAGMDLPYAGWSSAVGAGCLVHSVGERLGLHRQRFEAGWVSGAELARGVSTVTTTFTGLPRTVVIVIDDPGAAGQPLSERQLLLGLDGATRAADEAGNDRAPVLLSADNRSVLAYDIVPAGNAPVIVTVASEKGWSLVGVMASAEMDGTGAVALISARGLDAAVRPLAYARASEGAATSRLQWLGPTRSADDRALARARAQGGRALAAFHRRSAPPQRKPSARKREGRR
jgi:hypothetical protein